MSVGLNRILVATAVAVAVLVVPSAALADGCGGGPSAVQVYKECVPNGSGGQHASGAKGGGQSSGPKSVVISPSPQTAKALNKAGKSGKSLKRLVKAYGLRRVLESTNTTAAAEPTAIGSALDPGSGPTVLLIGLVGTAVLLIAAGGYRGIRHRHR